MLSFRRFLALAVLSLASCSEAETSVIPVNRVGFNDFEAVDGWTPNNPALSAVQAHSGRFSTKVDKDVEYSIGYINLLGKASSSKIQKLELRAWAFPSGPWAKASLVVQILNPKKNDELVFWDALDISKEAKNANRWNEVSKVFTLPAKVDAAHQLRVYMWRSGGTQATYLDDLEILKSE